MKVRFGMSEMMVVFSCALLWHSVAAAASIFAFSCLCAFARYAIEVNEMQKRTQATQEASKVLTEGAEDLGEALGQLFSFAQESKKKDDDMIH